MRTNVLHKILPLDRDSFLLGATLDFGTFQSACVDAAGATEAVFLKNALAGDNIVVSRQTPMTQATQEYVV